MACSVFVASAVGTIGFAPAGSFSSPEGFASLRGVGVNNTGGSAAGKVYVSDLVAGVLDRFGSAGEWEGVSASGLQFPFQLTVDQNAGPLEGDIYVAGQGAGVVYRFNPSLVLEEEIAGLEFPRGVAVTAGGDLFVSESGGSVLEFNSSGQPVDASGNPDPANTVIEGLSNPRALAVDGAGNVFVGTLEGTFEYTLSGGAYQRVEPAIDPSFSAGLAFTASGNLLTDIQTSFLDYQVGKGLVGQSGEHTLAEGWGIAANTQTNDVYVADRKAGVIDVFEEGTAPGEPTTEGAQPTGPASFIVHGTLSNEGTTSYYFIYNTGENCRGGTSTAAVSTSGGEVQAELTGLEALTQYSYCLVAVGQFGSSTGNVQKLTTEATPPRISFEEFASVGAQSAKIAAKVNPEHLPGHYFIEYSPFALTSDDEIKATPEVAYGSAGPVTVASVLTGLRPDSEYHFRIIARNNRGEIGTGEEIVFRTLAAPNASLPDGRAFEMVSPPNNMGADIYYPFAIGLLPLNEGIHTELPFAVAQDGNAVAYVSDFTSGGTGKGGKTLGNQYLAQRRTAGGWVQSNIQPAARLTTYYRGFSANLSSGVVMLGNSPNEPVQPPLAVGAPDEGASALYSCSFNAGPCQGPEELPGTPYRPLNGKPLNRSPFTFATSEAGHPVHITEGGGIKGPVFAAGTSDFRSMLFEANDAVPGVEEPFAVGLQESVLKEIQHGEDSDYLYDDREGHLEVVNVLPDGHVQGNATFGGPSGSENDQPDFTHVISNDGSRVFWTDLTTGMVYARIDGERTVQVSAGAARYWTASTDGRYAFYTEGKGAQSALYRFDLEGQLGAQRQTIAGESAGVLGVIGASEDGQNVYFVAEGTLGAPVSGEGTAPVAGQPNLYLSRAGGPPVFIGTLSLADGGSVKPFSEASHSERPSVGDWVPGAGNRTAEASADGGSVVFMSDRPLPSVGFPHGYPNNGDQEVYLYSASSNRLFCVSCSSSGELAPTAAGGVAAFLPISWVPTYLPQWVSDDGSRVFFDSSVPLVAQDTDNVIDVYEWEREGSGTCTQETAVNGGCVFLLSGGASGSSSWLLGASSSGSDAFIVSRAQLAREDQNEAFDLYDARVGGVTPPQPPACTGTRCQSVPSPPPVFATPSSGTFEGSGDFALPRPGKKPPKKKPAPARKLRLALRVCHKQHNPKRRAACVSRALRRYGPHSGKEGR
jgi:hypothetical protein